MVQKRSIPILIFIFVICTSLKAQLEVANLRYKDFSGLAFGAFVNVAIPVSDMDFVTAEAGILYSRDKYDDNAGLIPFIAGYRYTLNREGSGWYVEPYAGYSIGSADVGDYYESVNTSGATAGIGFGYLFERTRSFQFNLALRYTRCFGSSGTNVISFRISHAITFGRRE